MTVFLDASALVRRYVRDPDRALVLDAMAADPTWCVSEACRTETMLALHRVSPGPTTQAALWAAVREDWAAMAVVPVDDRCLARAVELGATFGLRTVDAIHLAAADRLPKPVTFVSFDRRQLPAAAALGLELLSPLAA